jgi:pseudouridine-5'-monophosphatase
VPPLPPTHVIFDLDGTLLDTEPLYTLAAQAVVGRYGKVFDWEIKRQIMGGGPLVGARFVVEHLGLPISPEDYLERREAILRELCTSVLAMPGAEQLVEALHGRGIPLAVGTSSTLELCEIKLASQAFAKHFAVMVCSDDPEVRQAKPAPDIFLVAAARMGADPARCLVFEDTTKGAQAAHAAGMQVIAVPDPQMRSESFSGALFVVDSLEQVTLERLGL